MYGQRIRELLVSAQGDGTALASSTAATSIIPAAAKIILPSQYLSQPGAVLNVYVAGRISTLNPTPGTFTLALRAGSIDAATSSAMAVNIGAAKTNVSWEARLTATVRVIGASAQLFFQWSATSEAFAINSATAGVTGTVFGPGSAPALGTAFDATAAQTIDLNGQWSISSASNSVLVHQYAVELS